MRKPKDLSVRLASAQVVVMVAVVGAFVLHSIVNIRSSDAINRKVDDVVGNAVPSIEYLTDARGQLRGMETAVQRAVRTADPASAPPARQALAFDRSEMDAALRSYVALPRFPGEHAPQREIADSRAYVDESLDETLTALGAGDRARAQALLTDAEGASDRLDVALQRTVKFNAVQAARMGRIMQVERSRLDQRILLIDGSLAGLSLIATALAIVTWSRAVAALQRRASELDLFAARVAHDLLSPLTTVAVALARAKKRLADDSAMSSTMERGERTLGRVRDLVAGLLEFAKAGASPGVGASTPVREAVRSVLDGLQDEAEAARVDVQFEPGPELHAACDRGCVTSLVQNLVRNAIRYMGEATRRVVTVRVQSTGRLVRVEVQDTGPGIPEAICRKLFQPFVRGTTAVPGLGLGLATVKKLSEGYGGRAGCESSSGEGSTFWFELPRAAASDERAGHPSQSARAGVPSA